MVFCTFAGVNFLAESAPESRNLRLKLLIFFRGLHPGPIKPPLWEMATSRTQPQHDLFGRARGQDAHLAGTHTLMLWGVPVSNRLKWQSYIELTHNGRRRSSSKQLAVAPNETSRASRTNKQNIKLFRLRLASIMPSPLRPHVDINVLWIVVLY